jgi:hypothetical protein
MNSAKDLNEHLSQLNEQCERLGGAPYFSGFRFAVVDAAAANTRDSIKRVCQLRQNWCGGLVLIATLLVKIGLRNIVVIYTSISL